MCLCSAETRRKDGSTISDSVQGTMTRPVEVLSVAPTIMTMEDIQVEGKAGRSWRQHDRRRDRRPKSEGVIASHVRPSVHAAVGSATCRETGIRSNAFGMPRTSIQTDAD